MWSSFFLLPQNNTYGAELDIAEVLSKDNEQVYNTTHGLSATGATAVNLHQVATPDLSSGFHTIGADWEPNQITWYVDGVVTAVEQTPYGFNLPMYMILGLAAGGTFPGNPSASTTSAQMNVDYVRSYATANTADVNGSGVIKTASVSGIVLLAGAGASTPANGVSVTLVNAADQVVATATTDANGYFIFTQLAAGKYAVLYGTAGVAVAAPGSQADATTGLSAFTTVTDGASVVLAPETLAPDTLAAVTGTVLYKANSTATSVVQSGVVVTLDNASGAAVDSTVTDASGTFRFVNLAAGSYQVVYTPLSYDALQPGGAAGASGTTAVFAASAGTTTTLAPETMAPAPAEISGTILYSGSHSEGWVGTGEGGVTVSLLNLSMAVLATTTTAGDGTYAFTNITPGYTYVEVSAPAGQVIATGFNANPLTGLTARVNAVAARGTVAPTVTLINAPAPGISGSVLFSGSGISGGDPGVTVTLLNRTQTVILATATTSVSGAFAFPDMEPGAYYLSYAPLSGEAFQAGGPANSAGIAAVTVTAAGGTLVVAPETLLGTAASVSGTVLYAPSFAAGTPEAGVVVDLVAGGATVQSVVTDSAGDYAFSGLVPETYNLLFVLPSGQRVQTGGPAFNGGATGSFTLTSGEALIEAIQTLTALPGILSGSVQYQGSGQAGVAVSLLEAGAAVATATTSSTGAYSFRYLTPGQYQVQFGLPSGEAPTPGGLANAAGLTGPVTVYTNQTTTLAAEVFTPTALTGTITGSTLLGSAAQPGVAVALLNASGTVATATTDANGNFSFANLTAGSYTVQYAAPPGEVLQSGPAGTTGLTAALAVTAGQTLALPAEILAPAPGTITGSTLLGSAAQPGVTVALLNVSGTVATATTDANGNFSFANLTAGSYTVQYAAPPGEVLQSGPAGTTGLTAALTVTAGQTLALPAEILAPAPGTITGSTLLGSAAQPGVTVALLNASGTVATATTDTNGNFSFANLTAGSYQVQYTAPSGDVLQSGPAGTTGLTAALAVTAGQTLALPAEILAAGTGTITGETLLGTTPQAGVTVMLLDGGGVNVLGTSITNSYGFYGFNGLAPGFYQVEYVAPAGEAIQSGPVKVATGKTGAFSVAAGGTRLLGPVTFAPAYAALTGSVSFAGAGQPGVTVALQTSAGAVAATTVTDSNGAFAFTNLAPGSYALAYTAPSGETFQAGDPANTATGVTAPFTLVAGQATVASTEHLVAVPVNLTLNGSRMTLTEGNGLFTVTGSPTYSTLTLGNGNQTVNLGGLDNLVTLGNGNQTVVLTGTSQSLHAGGGADTVTFSGNFNNATIGDTPAGQSSTFTLNGTGETIVAGNGTVTVAGQGGSTTVILGNGNDSVMLPGSHNSVTLGTGTSVVNAGTNGASIHTAGGNVTATVGGQNNTVDLGAGLDVINAGSARLDTFLVNGSGQGLTTISGFSATAGNVLDLTRTLAGTGIAADLSNIGQYVTATVSNGSTTLLVDPTGGGGTPYAFLTLQNVTTSVSALVGAHDIRVG